MSWVEGGGSGSGGDADTLEGSTKAQVISDAVAAADGVVDAATLGGDSKATIISTAKTNVNATQLESTSLSAIYAAALASAQAALFNPGTNGGRASVSSTDPTGSGNSQTLYYLPFKGNLLGLWDGSNWNPYTISGLTLAYNATALNGGGTLNNSVPYDLVCYLSGGVPTLGAWPWSSLTARATAVNYTDGVLTISGNKTHRVLASFLLLNSSGNKFWVSGSRRYLSNVDNRVPFAYASAAGISDYSISGVASYQTFNNSSPAGLQHRVLAAITADYECYLKTMATTGSGLIQNVSLSGSTPATGGAHPGGDYTNGTPFRADTLSPGRATYEATEIGSGSVYTQYISFLTRGYW